MKRLVVCSILLLASATVIGCHVPWVSPHERIAAHRPFVTPHTNVLPPAAMLMHPGPGVDGPGPGVLIPPPAMGPIGLGIGATSQIGFTGPDGMKIAWDVGGQGLFDSEPLIAPGRYNFPQGAIYRLKLTNVQGQLGSEFYPTLEVAPSTPRTEAYLAHNFIPFQLTPEDFDQVRAGNFVTKVIYLPDAEHQELALAGVETLVSTRLDPGLDPIVEADRRGSILAIIRLGNKDLEIPAEAVAGDEVVQASYLGHGGHMMGHGHMGYGGAMCGPDGYAPGGTGGGIPPGFVAGVTAPTYGMPMSGTPIGLPGPPHIPLGVPAGLQRHIIANHTHMHIPGPTEQVRIDVRQRPGLSYPKPASNVHIVENTLVPPIHYHQPHADKHVVTPGLVGEAECSDCDYEAP